MSSYQSLFRFSLFLICIGCDANKEDGISRQLSQYVDADGDGVLEELDCDDQNSETYPGAGEQCDGIDNDCDHLVDDADDEADWIDDATVFYEDSDGDGFGNASVTMMACELPDGYSTNADDCDDSTDLVSAGAPEICDGLDNDCDDLIDDDDDDVVEAGDWYDDVDGDGYGDEARVTTQCEQPSGTVAVGGDCDDSDHTQNPETQEVCDGIDNDCDDWIDDDDTGLVDATDWYADADADGFGDAEQMVTACDAPSQYADNPDDCDDGNEGINPIAGDTLGDGVDGDCDGMDCQATLVGETYMALCGLDNAGEDTGLFHVSVDWDEADYRCTSGGHDGLGQVASVSEFEGMLVLIGDVALSSMAWVGLSDADGDGVFSWTDGSSVDTDFMSWAIDEPSSQDECAGLDMAGEIQGDGCETVHGFFCESR